MRYRIASSFADIFFNNCIKNGIIPIVLDESLIQTIQEQVILNVGYRMFVNLLKKEVMVPDGTAFPFHLDASVHEYLLKGLDDIALTLQKSDAIMDFEKNHEQKAPWLFNRFGREAS